MGKPRRKIRPMRRESQCGDKKPFATLEDAEKAAFRPRKQLLRVGFMAAYRCRFCKQFHYGHPPGFK